MAIITGPWLVVALFALLPVNETPPTPSAAVEACPERAQPAECHPSALARAPRERPAEPPSASRPEPCPPRQR
jgi:hypothetical protein